MPGYTSQRRGTVRIFLTSELCCSMHCLCRLCCSLYCLCLYMCTVLLPPGANPIAVKYIVSYHIIYHIISYHIISYHIISYHIISYHIISYQKSFTLSGSYTNKSLTHSMLNVHMELKKINLVGNTIFQYAMMLLSHELQNFHPDGKIRSSFVSV